MKRTNMNMKRFWKMTTAAAAAITLTAGTAAADPGLRIRKPSKDIAPQLRVEQELRVEPVPGRGHGRLSVDVWTNVGEGGVAYGGEEVQVFFRTERNAFVTVFNIDARGQRTRLFPRYPGEDGFVRGGRTVALPDRWDDYALVVRGPVGIERIVVLASKRPLRTWNRHIDFDLLERGPYPARNLTIEPVGGPDRIRPPHRGVTRTETWFRVERRRHGRCW